MYDSTNEAIRDGELPIVELTVSAAILERILPYCYPDCIAPVELDLPTDDLDLFGALDRYEVGSPPTVTMIWTHRTSLALARDRACFKL